MTLTRINADQTAGIIRTGRPAGFWYAKAGNGWLGMSADGERCGVCVGSFPEVLTWLFAESRNPEDARETPRDRNVSRDPVWTASGDTDPGIRIPGAVIGEWREPVAVREIPRGLTINAERAAEIRAAGAETERTEPKRPPEEQKRKTESRSGNVGRPAGSASGKQIGTKQRDDKIARYVLDGLTDGEIAARVGLAVSTVQGYIMDMRMEGRFPDDQLPEWRVKRFRRAEHTHRPATPAEIREIERMFAEGASCRKIAARMGMGLSTVFNYCSGMRGKRDAVQG